MTYKEVFDLFCTTDSTGKEISDSTGIPRSTVYRILDNEKYFDGSAYSTVSKIINFLKEKSRDHNVGGRVRPTEGQC